MPSRRSPLLTALLAAACLALAGCGSTGAPTGPAAGPGAAPGGPAGPLSVGVTDGRLGGAVTDASGERERRLARGGPVDPAAIRRAPARRDGVAAGASCAHADLLPDPSNAATVAESTLCLLNAERADRGLAALRPSAQLQRAALVHGADMVDRGFFSHEGSNGSKPSERIRATGYLSSGGAWRIGENLAWGTGELSTPRSIMAAWMASPGHRANILHPAYREIGFAVIPGNPKSREGGGGTFVTEFGVVDRPRTAARRVARVQRRATTRRARVRARWARARRARTALAPRSRRGRLVGRLAAVRGGLG